MSVIACAPQATSSTASGVTTRSSAKNHSSSGNTLFVKGAAEYMLSRCSKVPLLAQAIVMHIVTICSIVGNAAVHVLRMSLLPTGTSSNATDMSHLCSHVLMGIQEP